MRPRKKDGPLIDKMKAKCEEVGRIPRSGMGCSLFSMEVTSSLWDSVSQKVRVGIIDA